MNTNMPQTIQLTKKEKLQRFEFGLQNLRLAIDYLEDTGDIQALAASHQCEGMYTKLLIRHTALKNKLKNVEKTT